MAVSELLQTWEIATINTSVALALAKKAGIRPFPATAQQAVLLLSQENYSIP